MKFVDLGLPSGLLWATENYNVSFSPSYFTARQAKLELKIQKHFARIPTLSDFEELRTYCNLEWKNGSICVTGKNKNIIRLHPFGYRLESHGLTFQQTDGYYTTSEDHLKFKFDDLFVGAVKLSRVSTEGSLRLVANSYDCFANEIY